MANTELERVILVNRYLADVEMQTYPERIA